MTASPMVTGGVRADTTVYVEQSGGDYRRSDVRHMPEPVVRGGDSLRRALGMQTGLYILNTRGSTVLTVVDTAKREYFQYDEDSARRAMPFLLERVPHTGDTVFVSRVLPDTVVGGLKVQHWRRTSVLTLRATIIGEFTAREIADLYIATEAKQVQFDVSSYLPQSLLSGVAYQRELEQVDAKLPRGLWVLFVSRGGIDDGSGKPLPAQSISTMTRQMSDIQYRDIPSDAFAIPPGYRRVAPPVSPSQRIPPRPQ